LKYGCTVTATTWHKRKRDLGANEMANGPRKRWEVGTGNMTIGSGWLMLPMLWFGGCNSDATAADPSPVAPPRLTSREFESCASSGDCSDELRCFDQVCRRTSRSVVGDYYAAVGSRAAASGDADSAVAAFAEALSRYDLDKIPLPPEVDCNYGAALAQNRGRKEQAELAARVLHRCISSVPVGADIRQRAFADLATLADMGLEPAVLAKSQSADLYLTRVVSGNKRVPTVTVSAAPTPIGKTFNVVMTAVNAEPTKSALLRCWDVFASSTKQPALTVEVGAKARFVAPEYEEDPARYTISLDGSAGAGTSPEVVADACVRVALDAATKRTTGLRDAFVTKFIVRFQ
jgi:hypothetical protein